MNLYRELESRWPSGHAPAIIGAGETIDYSHLRLRVARAASWLEERGMRPGQVLALQLPRCPAMLELALACFRAGVLLLPINDRYTPREVDFMLKDSGARLAILPESVLGRLRGSGHRLVSQEGLRRQLDESLPARSNPAPNRDDAPALLCYTSGTTGRPKGALLSHGNLAATLHALHRAWAWSPADRLLHVLPLYHVHGLVVAQLGALYAGALSIWMDRFDPLDVLLAIREHGITLFMGVPTFYSRFVALPSHVVPDLSSVRLFTSGSAPLPASVHESFRKRYGHSILERYGMTEVGMVLSNPYAGPRRPGSVGIPLPGVRARVVHRQSGRELPAGQVGEIQVRGPSVFQGYLGLPEQSAAALEKGWMKTGDLGYRDPDGYYHLVGRSNDMIITGGFNVYPRQVEAVLEEHPDVAEAAVLGIPAPDLGEEVAAAVVPRAGAEVSTEELARFARKSLAPYKSPRTIRLLAELPRNAMGKVRKSLVREMLAHGGSSRVDKP